MIQLQKGIVKDNNGVEQVVICDVSNPNRTEVLMAFFNSWNSPLIAENIINLLIEKDKELIQK